MLFFFQFTKLIMQLMSDFIFLSLKLLLNEKLLNNILILNNSISIEIKFQSIIRK